jgi:hypothetical protein
MEYMWRGGVSYGFQWNFWRSNQILIILELETIWITSVLEILLNAFTLFIFSKISHFHWDS